MAQIVYLNSSVSGASKVTSALNQIRSGIYDLKELDGLRAESIGAGQDIMAQNFGASGVDQAAKNSAAQALSDRIGAFLAAYDDTGNAEFAKLRDLLNATATAP